MTRLTEQEKQEIIRVKSEETGEWEEMWTGDFIFENEWQLFRTKKGRSPELKSVFHECKPGRRARVDDCKTPWRSHDLPSIGHPTIAEGIRS